MKGINATNFLILAMREKWLNLILEGKKTAEVRRTRPARECDMPDYLYLYHRGHIHGIAEVKRYSTPLYKGTRSAPPRDMQLWAVTVAEHHEKARLERREMLSYLAFASAPVVYFLGKVERFEKPIPVPCRPQSWQYATPELLEVIWKGDAK